MRIISQNGNYSVNFDNVLLERRDDMVLARIDFDMTIVLGRYDNDEEAEEVFADIHGLFDEQYDRPFNPEEWIEIYRMPQAGK